MASADNVKIARLLTSLCTGKQSYYSSALLKEQCVKDMSALVRILVDADKRAQSPFTVPVNVNATPSLCAGSPVWQAAKRVIADMRATEEGAAAQNAAAWALHHMNTYIHTYTGAEHARAKLKRDAILANLGTIIMSFGGDGSGNEPLDVTISFGIAVAMYAIAMGAERGKSVELLLCGYGAADAQRRPYFFTVRGGAHSQTGSAQRRTLADRECAAAHTRIPKKHSLVIP